MKMRFVLFSLIGTAVLISGCQQNKTEDEQAAIPVAVTEIQAGNVVQTLNYNGDIRAEQEVKVFSKIPDRIERYNVDEGDFIRKGDIIAVIRATTIEQIVKQAEAGYNAVVVQAGNMKTEYDRAVRLHEEDAMSQQQFDAVQTQYEAVNAQLMQAEAGLVSAKSQYADAMISAPIAGIIGQRFYEPGDMAAPALPVVSIVQMNRVKVECEATEQDLGRLATGQKAEIRVRSFPDESFTGKLNKISPVLDPLTRMAKIEVLLDNPDHKLKPGMYAEAEITTGVLENTLVVPRNAVIESTTLKATDGTEKVEKNYFVYIVSDSMTAVQRQLQVDYVNHRVIAVHEGVKLGEKLVTAGQNNLRDGLPVIIPSEQEAEK
ncbi:efflux RND transporter periplasmic adaptor subunit [bacterium]|nr:efflux RND transporter periplasmic adaptor subunit [bacterium]